MKGILPSLNTPFSKKGDLDLKSLEKLVKHTIRSGCSGMLGLAVAGEHKLLSFKEKIAFIELVKYTNKERIPFIVSVSDLQSEDSIKLSKIAKKNNATGINIQINQNTSTADNLKLLKEIGAASSRPQRGRAGPSAAPTLFWESTLLGVRSEVRFSTPISAGYR